MPGPKSAGLIAVCALPGDNAVGVALLGVQAFAEDQKKENGGDNDACSSD